MLELTFPMQASSILCILYLGHWICTCIHAHLWMTDRSVCGACDLEVLDKGDCEDSCAGSCTSLLIEFPWSRDPAHNSAVFVASLLFCTENLLKNLSWGRFIKQVASARKCGRPVCGCEQMRWQNIFGKLIGPCSPYRLFHFWLYVRSIGDQFSRPNVG